MSEIKLSRPLGPEPTLSMQPCPDCKGTGRRQRWYLRGANDANPGYGTIVLCGRCSGTGVVVVT